ncbi:MAG: hypothetical protein A2029_11195 [Chloroflexi bacterium RBG_19FT_COMBO_47_9]|nr:MAG: hypothetical protein A2029_11195 [Chloroflexi bacterium RBG_19FT_COMBO_47_9]
MLTHPSPIFGGRTTAHSPIGQAKLSDNFGGDVAKSQVVRQFGNGDPNVFFPINKTATRSKKTGRRLKYKSTVQFIRICLTSATTGSISLSRLIEIESLAANLYGGSKITSTTCCILL